MRKKKSENENLELKKDNFGQIKNLFKNGIKKVNKFLDKRLGNYTYRTITCCTLILIGIVLVFVMAFGGRDKVLNYPLLFINDDEELMIINYGDKDPSKIANVDEDEDYVKMAYANNTERYILYIKDDNLYYYDAAKKDDSLKIASDVVSYGFTENDKLIYYINDENELYISDKKDKTKLDSDVESVVYALGDKILYVKDDSLYIRGYSEKKNDKEKIVNDYVGALVSDDNKKVLIATNEELYLYTIKSNEKVKITGEYKSVVAYDDNFDKIIYAENNEESTDLSKLLIDNKKQDDEDFKEITFSDYLNDKATYEEYSQNQELKDEIDVRNEIREYVQDVDLGTSTLKIFSNGESKDYLKDVGSVVYTDLDEESILYFKGEISSKKLNIEDYDYLYDFVDDFEKLIDSGSLYLYNGKEDILITDEELVKDARIDGKYVYYLAEDDDEYELFYATIKGDKVDESGSLDTGIYYSSFRDGLKDGYLYFADMNDDGDAADLKVVKNGEIETIASDVLPENLQTNLNKTKLYYMTEYSDQEGTLNVYNGSKSKKLIDEVAMFVHINDNYMYLFKNYSDKNDTMDLYSFNGSKDTLVAENIKAIGENILYVKGLNY